MRKDAESTLKKKLSPEQKQHFEDELRKSQEAAIQAERKRAQVDIENERYQAAKRTREEAEKAQALKKFELRRKSHARTLKRAPYGDLEEYAYFEAEKARRQEKIAAKEKNKKELDLLNELKKKRNDEFINRARETLGYFASDKDILEEAEKLAQKAYKLDRSMRGLKELEAEALQKQQFWKDRRAELDAVKSGVTTRVKSVFDLLGKHQTEFRKKMISESKTRATEQWLAQQKALEPLRTQYMKHTNEKDIANIRKELSNQEKDWLGSSYTIPANEKKVQEMAAQRKEQEFENWATQYRMTTPVTPISVTQPLSTPTPQTSSWWNRLKQRFTNTSSTNIPSSIWMKR